MMPGDTLDQAHAVGVRVATIAVELNAQEVGHGPQHTAGK
jgi:hypothetical protein